MTKKVVNTTKKIENTTKKWEYAIIFGIEYTEDSLNDRGREGWELCTVLIDPADPLVRTYFLKREIG